jgi:oxygen-dependent protoporphyrinogen oxidase
LGVYAGDPSYLVTKYALPKLYNLEQSYGSFIGGSLRKSFKKKTEAEKKVTRKIFTIVGGLGKLTNTLYQKIGTEKFELGATAVQIKKLEKGFKINLTDSKNQSLEFTSAKVITTIPAFNLHEALPFVGEKLVAKVQNVYYAPVVEVAIGFNEWKGIPLDGFGGLIPYKEDRNLLGVMYMSSLFENRAPKGGALISVFIGGARKPGLTQLSDDEIKALVKREFKELMGVSDFNPDLFELSWHLRAIPQYGKESKERFEAVDVIQNTHKGLLIGGNLQGGIGMADRVKQGKFLADTIINSEM